MKNVIRPGAMGLVILFLAGCQTDPQATREIALLRAEILDLEDQYYALKSEHEDVINTLRAIEGDVAPGTETIWLSPDDSSATFDQPIGSGARVMAADNETPNGRQPLASNASKSIRRSRHQTVDREPWIEQPGAAGEQVAATPVSAANKISTPPRSPSQRPVLPTAPAHRISIDRRVTVGRDADDALGDEGIELAVSLTDDDDRLTLPEGSLYVQLSTTGDDQGDSLTLAEWQFNHDELMNFLIRPDLPLRGFLIHLPWQQTLPFENQIDVNVSWVGQDGQMLEDRAQIKINPPVPDYRLDAAPVLRWLENDVRWIDSSDSTTGTETTSAPDRNASRPRWRPLR